MTTHHTTNPRRAKPRHGVLITRQMTEAEQLALIDGLPTVTDFRAKAYVR